MRTHEISTRINFETPKCPQGKTLDPQNTHESHNSMESPKFSKLNRKPLRILLVGSIQL